MKNPNGEKPRSERLLDGLVKELQSMTDTDALEGESPEDLVKLGERLLLSARAEAGKLRMADAKRRLAVISENEISATLPSAAEARKYLQSLPDLTLAARNLNDLSDADVLDLFNQATSLQDTSESEGD
jgi:hypothetical protein